MKVGDIVISNHKYPTGKSDILFFEKGQKMIILETKNVYCTCKNNNGWKFYWTGFIREEPLEKWSTRCNVCKAILVMDNKIWVADQHLDEIEKKEVDLVRVDAQLDLLKSFAKGQIKNVSFEKILDMLDGDPEMLELGKQLLEQKKNE